MNNPNLPSNLKIPDMDRVRLFNHLAHKMVHYAIEQGYGFPAVKFTEEDIEMFAPYQIGGLIAKYNTTPYEKEYAKQEGVVDDSKSVSGLLDAPIDGMKGITLHVLGEGPSIHYGEFGRITLSDEQGIKVRTYVLGNDGSVIVSTGIDDAEQAVMDFDEPHEVTLEQLAKLTSGLEAWQVIPQRTSEL